MQVVVIAEDGDEAQSERVVFRCGGGFLAQQTCCSSPPDQAVEESPASSWGHNSPPADLGMGVIRGTLCSGSVCQRPCSILGLEVN